jgi:hypothetical protein
MDQFLQRKKTRYKKQSCGSFFAATNFVETLLLLMLKDKNVAPSTAHS